MKIYHLLENLDDSYGGPAKSVPYLIKNLADLDIQGQMLSIKYKNNESNEVVKSNNLNWLSFKYDFIKKLRYSKELKTYLTNILKKQNNTILHSHNLWNYIPYISFMLSKKYDIPLILSTRGALYPWSLSQRSFQKKIVWKFFQREMLDQSSCVHVTNISELNAVRSLGISSPIALVPNGINLDEFKIMNKQDVSKKNLGLKENKNYVLFLSRIHPKKGLEYLVYSWIKISKKYHNWNLLIVGPVSDHKYFNKLQDELKKYNLNDRVHFTGMLRGKKRIDCYSASSLFVLPSHTENFGIAIAEAMAAKLPVITTKGTPWEEIEENDAGWWVQLNQQNIQLALTNALSCSDLELKKKGLNGFNLIKKYDWKYQSIKMKKVYEWTLDNKKKPEFVFLKSDKYQ